MLQNLLWLLSWSAGSVTFLWGNYWGWTTFPSNVSVILQHPSSAQWDHKISNCLLGPRTVPRKFQQIPHDLLLTIRAPAVSNQIPERWGGKQRQEEDRTCREQWKEEYKVVNHHHDIIKRNLHNSYSVAHLVNQSNYRDLMLCF